MVFTGDIYACLWFPIIVAAMTLVVGAIFLPETRHRDLREEDQFEI